MNLLPRTALALAALAPLAAGCAHQAADPAPQEAVAPAAPAHKAEVVPECCRPPSRDQLFTVRVLDGADNGSMNVKDNAVPQAPAQPAGKTTGGDVVAEFLKPAPA